MANKQALRELQTRLAERLAAARTEKRVTSWLAVECAGYAFLLPLEQAGEIFPAAPVVHLAHAQSWFLGVANLRGGLFGVVDLARFLGIRESSPELSRDPPRLVVFNPALGLNCALMIDKLAGLRSADQLEADRADDSPKPDFVGVRYRDTTGRVWQELNLAALAGDEAFLKIVG